MLGSEGVPLSTTPGVDPSLSGKARPATRSGNEVPEVRILFEGYADQGVASTVGYVRDGRARIVIDPGIVPSPRSILSPLYRSRERVLGLARRIVPGHGPAFEPGPKTPR